MKYINTKHKIFIPNVIFAQETTYGLKAEELLVYVHLQLLQQAGNFSTGTKQNKFLQLSLDNLLYSIGWDDKEVSKKRKKSREILEKLEEKGYIKLNQNNNISNLYNIEIIASMNNLEETVYCPFKRSKKMKFAKYNTITSQLINKADNPIELMMLNYMDWRSGLKIDYGITYEEWAFVLDVSERTVRNYVEKSNTIKKINNGFIVEKNRYRPNSYEIRKNNDFNIHEKLNGTVDERIIESQIKKITDVRVKDNIKIFEELTSFNKKISDEAFIIYMTTDDNWLKRLTNTKLAKILKSSKNGEYVVKKMFDEYNKKLAKINGNSIGELGEEDNINISSEVKRKESNNRLETLEKKIFFDSDDDIFDFDEDEDELLNELASNYYDGDSDDDDLFWKK